MLTVITLACFMVWLFVELHGKLLLVIFLHFLLVLIICIFVYSLQQNVVYCLCHCGNRSWIEPSISMAGSMNNMNNYEVQAP